MMMDRLSHLRKSRHISGREKEKGKKRRHGGRLADGVCACVYVCRCLTRLLDLPIQEALDLFPDRIRPGAEDVASGDVVIIDHLTPPDDLRVPITELGLLLRRDPQQGLPLLLRFLVLRRRHHLLRNSSSSSRHPAMDG